MRKTPGGLGDWSPILRKQSLVHILTPLQLAYSSSSKLKVRLNQYRVKKCCSCDICAQLQRHGKHNSWFKGFKAKRADPGWCNMFVIYSL
jgi:hypothetical protein